MSSAQLTVPSKYDTHKADHDHRLSNSQLGSESLDSNADVPQANATPSILQLALTSFIKIYDN